MHGNRNLLIICKFVIAQMRKATQASGPFVPANKAGILTVPVALQSP